METTVLSLNELGLKHGTDKASTGHDYLSFYEMFFSPMRQKPVKLLEIGVFTGKSVAMWEEYFPNGSIVGIDIEPNTRRFATDRVQIVIADQSNVADLVGLGVDHGPFDIVIDDGSHFWNHQITSIQYLFPFLKRDGFYVVEDIDSSFGSLVAHCQKDATVSAFDYVSRFTRFVTAGHELDASREEDPFIRTYAGKTKFIAFRQGTVVIRADLGLDDRMFHAPPALIAPEPGDLTRGLGSMTVHIGLYGDATNRDELIGGVKGRKTHTIQGFVIDATSGPLTDLQYMAAFSDGTRSDWVGVGTFLGSRGRNVAVRSVCAKLIGPSADMFNCIVAGAFAATERVVVAEDGGECAVASDADLEALQIFFRPRAAR